jgi:menaquinone-specific isochorismate synthase
MTNSPAPADAGLVARTIALDGPIDLLEFAGDDGLLWEHEGAGFAGRGVALRIHLPRGHADVARVAEALAAFERDDEVGVPGCGPVAIGALPFEPGTPCSLVVPETIVGRRPDGSAWMTTIGPGATPRPATPAARSPWSFSLVSSQPHDEWCAEVERAVDAIKTGAMRKVVLAREVVVEAGSPLVTVDILRRLRALHPSCMVFSVEGFVGASPELLVSRDGDVVRSHPLAGTVPRSGDPAADDRLAAGLLASAKDRREHAFVVDAVAGLLRPLCTTLDVPDTPSIVPLRNVSHLGTAIAGRLAAPAPSALELALRLHPTPAVGGTPTEAALCFLASAEGRPRGRYAGPVGWVDADGNGAWAIGIRSAELSGNRARMLAGVGVVEGSDPEAELAETQLKLQALLAAVVRP